MSLLGVVTSAVLPALAVVLPVSAQPRLPGLDLTARVNGNVLLGQGWGCAQVSSDAGSAWACWKAPEPVGAARVARTGGGALASWRVPWLSGRSPQTGRDRICALEREELRCWYPPERDQKQPREWPRPPQSGPSGGEPAAPPGGYLDAGYLFDRFVGGTFACVSKAQDLWCMGDNRYGQLGQGDQPGDSPPLLGFDRITNVAIGFWHACVSTAHPVGREDVLYCWGRGDVGQLGVTAPDLCPVDGHNVPCARRPQKVPFHLGTFGMIYAPNRERGHLRAGDLFTCSHTTAAIVCWGASRDGFFGSRAQCPGHLRRSWPTLGGPSVHAPHAACSSTPVPIAGSDSFKAYTGPWVGGKPAGPPTVTTRFDVGPRGICMVSNAGKVWCKGAVPSPRLRAASSVQVSPGDDASACATTDAGQLFCWGEAYSPPRAPHRPVRILFEDFAPPPANPNPAPVDFGSSEGKPWGNSCLVNRGCAIVAVTLAACPSGTAARDWSQILPQAGRLSGNVVSVRGTLQLGRRFQLAIGCHDEIDPVTKKPLPVTACCRDTYVGVVVVGADGSAVELEPFQCAGDRSRVCCNVAAKGQTVIATGRLDPWPESLAAPWKLAGDVKLCLAQP